MSSEASGPGGSEKRFMCKGRLPILWSRSLNPMQGAQDIECITKHSFLIKNKTKQKKLFFAGVRGLTEFLL